ncbi:unnamed protein product [Pleuronectes platessa]|uniref:Uncharacterized protein n=1 Tax=Pleuronectes platessa TaxID=8262 RepID=A0A9N7VKJ4_PLEPL|nr:unnamed protein product [Pleuronectes platessa]
MRHSPAQLCTDNLTGVKHLTRVHVLEVGFVTEECAAVCQRATCCRKQSRARHIVEKKKCQMSADQILTVYVEK